MTINDVILRLVAFTTGLYAFVIAMVGALAPQHLLRCNDVKHFDGAPGAIAVALAVIFVGTLPDGYVRTNHKFLQDRVSLLPGNTYLATSDSQ
jgi:hypothetical protein